LAHNQLLAKFVADTVQGHRRPGARAMQGFTSAGLPLS
jgi:hypothetical protein